MIAAIISFAISASIERTTFIAYSAGDSLPANTLYISVSVVITWLLTGTEVCPVNWRWASTCLRELPVLDT